MGATYLIAAWRNTEAGRAEAEAQLNILSGTPGWTARIQAPGLAIWTRAPPDLPVVNAPALDGVIVGQLFAKGGSVPATSDLHALSAPDPPARARQLLAGCWGSYVAVLRDPDGTSHWILRDPSGALDVLTWRRGGLAFAASDLAGLPPGLGPRNLALDWDAITDFLRRPATIPARCGFRGLETVTPGDLHPLGGAAKDAQALWRPAACARRPPPPSDGLEDELRAALETAVAGALAPFRRCLIEVSGGLDSAIVALTAERLGMAGKIAVALHFQGDRPECDERAWALPVMEALGRPAQVAALELARFGPEDFVELARGARPAINALDVGRDRETRRLCEALGVEALITGKGGDAAFFQHPTPQVLSDLVAARGVRHLLGAEARAIALRLRRSVWSVACDAWAALPYRARRETPLALWGPRTRREPAAAAHPWLEGLEDLPPAKRYQIGGLVMTQVHRGATGYGQGREVLHPLLSQPVLELTLSIPTWELQRGGRDRGLARDTFADRLPAAVVGRRSKGEMGSFYARTLAANREFLWTYLGEGCLAEAGVLDPRGLAAVLDPDALIWRAEVPGVLNAVVIEAWVRHWQTLIPDAAEASRRWP